MLRNLLAALAAVLIFSMPTLAQEIKIGYVNAVILIETAPQGEAALKKLEEEFGDRDRKLKALRDEIRNLEADLERNVLVMTDEERIDRERELRDLRRRARREQQEFRDDYNLRRNEELRDLQRLVSEAINEIAQKDKYDLILQDSVFASKRIDLTDRVLEKLKAEFEKNGGNSQ